MQLKREAKLLTVTGLNTKHKHEPVLDQNIYNEELDSEFTASELQAAVFTQKNNKSPGIDNIICEILKTS